MLYYFNQNLKVINEEIMKSTDRRFSSKLFFDNLMFVSFTCCMKFSVVVLLLNCSVLVKVIRCVGKLIFKIFVVETIVLMLVVVSVVKFTFGK